MSFNLHLVFIALEIAGFLVCDSADIQSMRANIQNHFSEARHHETNNAYKLKARKYIYDEFKRFGLETHYQNFTNGNYPNVMFANVIGILKGERFGKLDDQILGVAAHYDTMPHTPGVDDNGAGVAAMLEVIRQVTEANKQGTKRQNTIMFVSFDAEELLFIGGYTFTNGWLGTFLQTNYGQDFTKLSPHGVIVMDTMMNYNTSQKSQIIPKEYLSQFQQYFPKASTNIAKDNFEGDFLLLTYRQPTNDSKLAAQFVNAWKNVGRTQFEIESFPLPLADPGDLNRNPALGNFMRSDHVALWYYNVPAIFISDSANYRGEMVQCYHHECDNLQNLLTDDNINFLGKTADAITSTLNSFSSGPTSEASANLGKSVFLFGVLVLYYLVCG